jgi:tyrosine-specific transport protein
MIMMLAPMIAPTIGSVLLIAGTCVGAGMLALPVTTAASGYIPSILLLIGCWLMMLISGLYVMEVNMAFKEKVSFISMAEETLGTPGKIISWVSYLLLLYSLMAAYLSGGSSIFLGAAQSVAGADLPSWTGPMPWVLVVGAMIFLGAKFVDHLNRWMMIGLVVTFIILAFFLSPHVNSANLVESHPVNLLMALPIVITAFGYQVIVPSVCHYIGAEPKTLRKAIIIGSLVPLVVYILWETDVFGIIPIHGAQGLSAMFAHGQPAAELPQTLANILHSHWVIAGARAFAFFAIASSFLGVALSLFDFLADGLKISNSPRSRLVISILTLVPPLFYAWYFPRGFIVALSYAGIFVAVLNGILPALMAWIGRRKGLIQQNKTPGGHFAMVAVMLFCVVVIAAQIFSKA